MAFPKAISLGTRDRTFRSLAYLATAARKRSVDILSGQPSPKSEEIKRPAVRHSSHHSCSVDRVACFWSRRAPVEGGRLGSNPASE